MRFGDLTIEEQAGIYVELISGPPNAWGQHIHPTLGVSHAIMGRMWQQHGQEEADEAIDKAFERTKA